MAKDQGCKGVTLRAWNRGRGGVLFTTRHRGRGWPKNVRVLFLHDGFCYTAEMGKYTKARVLNIPDEPCIILNAEYLRQKKESLTEPPDTYTRRFKSSTNIILRSTPFINYLYNRRLPTPQPLYWYISPQTNCVILAQTDDPDGRKTPFYALLGNKNCGYRTRMPDRYLPPLSYGVAVRDFYLTQKLLIFRWPLLLYDQPVRSTDCQHRTIDRQRCESQFIEATFPPLRQRPEPYPFFVPTLPLDPLWTPPAQPEMANPPERNPEPGTA